MANPNPSHRRALPCPSLEETTYFEDFLPIMVEKLGVERFMVELCNGFRLLVDDTTGTITLASLKTKAALLGLKGMTEDEAFAMIKQGDLDNDGALNEEEFCILMIRTSPSMMADAETWLEDVLMQDLGMECE